MCSIFLVFEYCTHDLGRLVDAMPRPFSPSEVKCLMLQVCPEFHEHFYKMKLLGGQLGPSLREGLTIVGRHR